MFKQFIKDQYDMVTGVGNAIEKPSDKAVFYGTFFLSLFSIAAVIVWTITLPFRMIRKAF